MCRRPEAPPPDLLSPDATAAPPIAAAIADARRLLRSRTGRVLEGPVPTPCLEAACDTYRRLRRATRKRTWLALGYVSTAEGAEPHAWVLHKTRKRWEIVDSTRRPAAAGDGPAPTALGRSGYEALAYLSGPDVRVVPGQVRGAPFAPAFFLDIHLRIEMTALGGLGFADGEVAAMNLMNWQADMKGYDPREHGDDSALLEALLLTEDRLAWKGGTTPQKTVVDAPRAIAYGLAFHTLADFYAHSSYVPTAAYFYGGLANVPTFDVAAQSAPFLAFLEGGWSNRLLWHAPRGYTVRPFQLPAEHQQCLISGAYPQGAGSTKDGWVTRAGLPIHDELAIDQPDSALVHQNPIQSRKHPFAFPHVWSEQFARREALATLHIREVATRLLHGHPDPLLGVPVSSLPAGLFSPEWQVPGKGALGSIPHLTRGPKGEPV